VSSSREKYNRGDRVKVLARRDSWNRGSEGDRENIKGW